MAPGVIQVREEVCRPRTFEEKPIGVLNSQCTLGLDRSGTSACTWSFLASTQLYSIGT